MEGGWEKPMLRSPLACNVLLRIRYIVFSCQLNMYALISRGYLVREPSTVKKGIIINRGRMSGVLLLNKFIYNSVVRDILSTIV